MTIIIRVHTLFCLLARTHYNKVYVKSVSLNVFFFFWLMLCFLGTYHLDVKRELTLYIHIGLY